MSTKFKLTPVCLSCTQLSQEEAEGKPTLFGCKAGEDCGPRERTGCFPYTNRSRIDIDLYESTYHFGG